MAGAYQILLFDIDGTLISSGGAGTVAWRQAFDELHGIPADIAEFTDAGMTDPDVGARTFEAALHRKPTPHELAQLNQRRLEHLPEAVAASTGYKVLPGRTGTTQAAQPGRAPARAHHRHGDGAAHVKLQRGDLNRWFTFGAYASAGLDRAGIVREAVQRGEAIMGEDVPNADVS